uniref:Uncharacterized protein n=1 Tax=Vespula pensylvanica TaxID=30213 RepID=A0A834P7A9_VESPE|nr:hypothetical protein H0235_004337 [Vespula pensylvanica]
MEAVVQRVTYINGFYLSRGLCARACRTRRREREEEEKVVVVLLLVKEEEVKEEEEEEEEEVALSLVSTPKNGNPRDLCTFRVLSFATCDTDDRFREHPGAKCQQRHNGLVRGLPLES